MVRGFGMICKSIAILAVIFACSIQVKASFHNEADFVDVAAPSASVEYDRWLPGSSANSAYRIPNEIFKRIAHLSGNRLGLSGTCKTLWNFDYVAQQNITLTLPRGFSSLAVFKLIMSGQYKFRWASDVVNIDAYQCSLKDLMELGFFWSEVQYRWLRKVEIKQSGFTQLFTNVKEIHICICGDLHEEAKEMSFGNRIVRLVEDKYHEIYHDLFKLYYLNGKRLRMLLDLYIETKETNKYGRVPQSDLLPKKEYIFQVLDHYESFKLLREDLGVKTKLNMQQVLLLNVRTPHIIELIKKLHITRLCDFEWLFDLLAHRSEKEIYALSHDQTDEMISLLRSFIPDYGPECFDNGRVKVECNNQVILTKNHEALGMRKYQFSGEDILRVQVEVTNTNNLTRNEVFYEIACALVNVERGKQYALLSRLIPLLAFNELGQAIWTPRSKNTRRLTDLFRHGLELTERYLLDLSDEQYDHFAVYVKVRLHYQNIPFNILEATDKELQTVLKSAQKTSKCVVQ